MCGQDKDGTVTFDEMCKVIANLRPGPEAKGGQAGSKEVGCQQS